MSVFVPAFRDRVAFAKKRFNPVALAGNERVKVLLVCLEPGQFIPVHQPGVDLTLAVLEGKGRLVAFHIVTPPPTEADHAGVVAMLKQGRWK